MPGLRPFRFGVVHEQPQGPDAWKDHLRRVEDLGFSTFLIRDHFVRGLLRRSAGTSGRPGQCGRPDDPPAARDHGARGGLSPPGDAREGSRHAGSPVRRPSRAGAWGRLAPPRVRDRRPPVRFGRHPDRSSGGDDPDPRRPVRRGPVLVHRQALHGRLAGRPAEAGPSVRVRPSSSAAAGAAC